MHADPKSAEKAVKLSSFIALLGSAQVKAARKMLVKSTPELPEVTAWDAGVVGRVVLGVGVAADIVQPDVVTWKKRRQIDVIKST